MDIWVDGNEYNECFGWRIKLIRGSLALMLMTADNKDDEVIQMIQILHELKPRTQKWKKQKIEYWIW